MSVVNVADGFSHYSTEELINYANNGCLFAGSVDLSSFVEYILDREDTQKEFSQEDVDNAWEEGYAGAVYKARDALDNL